MSRYILAGHTKRLAAKSVVATVCLSSNVAAQKSLLAKGANMSINPIKSALALALIGAVLISQSACSMVGRLKQPIADFKTATNVVTESARLSYDLVNRNVLDEALQEAQCADIDPLVPCVAPARDPSVPRLNSTALRKKRVFSDEGMKARLDALASLDSYVGLLDAMVNTDKPEQIAASAAKLKTSIDNLALKITELAKPNTPGSGGGGGDSTNGNTVRFLNAVGLFTTATEVILTAIANRKREKALKRAIENGNGPVKELIEALKTDFAIFWTDTNLAANDRIALAYNAFNTEIANASADPPSPRSDSGRQRLRTEILVAEAERDLVNATSPVEAVDKMQAAHSAMVKWSTEPTEANFIASLQAIQNYVAVATKLGTAVVKLYANDKES